MFPLDWLITHELMLAAAREQKKEPKMTREEAFNKLKNSAVGKIGTAVREEGINDWLNGLEALGLIKFDEPKQPKYKYVFKSQSGNEYKVLDTFVRIEE